MTHYLESTEDPKYYEEDYTVYRSKVLHENIPTNYRDHKAKYPGCEKFTYIYQICWSIKFLRKELKDLIK